ncbi:hypothetical protein ACNKHX_02525 [Shigella flexneri]
MRLSPRWSFLGVHSQPAWFLEVLVLSRLNMRQGASYAITTILNYIIIAVGAMTRCRNRSASLG